MSVETMRRSSPDQSGTYLAPNSIVVFKEREDHNADVLADILAVKEAWMPGLSRSCLQFERQVPGCAGAKLFHRLAAATAWLKPEDEDRLRKHPRVDTVVRNQIRSLPKGADYAIDPADVVRIAAGGAGAAPPGQAAYDWHLAKVGAIQGVLSGRNVTVAVLDTGIDQNHPDFQGRTFNALNSINYVEAEGLHDLNGHGTHCAGLLAGPMFPNAGPRYGVAPNVNLLIAKVMDQNGLGIDDEVMEAIDWAADHGARIISLSLGTPRATGEPYDPLYERVASALLEETPGALVLAAVGNESQRGFGLTSPVANPAACPSIFGVTAVDQNDAVAPDSCGEMDPIGQVDVAAPGVNLYSAWPGGIYRLRSGTSSATPIAAGIAALLLEQNPNLSAAQLRDLLLTQNHIQALGPRVDFGAGLLHL